MFYKKCNVLFGGGPHCTHYKYSRNINLIPTFVFHKIKQIIYIWYDMIANIIVILVEILRRWFKDYRCMFALILRVHYDA